MKELTIEEQKKLKALAFMLEQELSRGSWDNETESEKLIEFAESFNKQFVNPDLGGKNGK